MATVNLVPQSAMTRIFFLLVCMAVSSCAGTPSGGGDANARTYDAPADKVFGATVKAFQNLKLEIFQENREKAFVEGGRKVGALRGSETVRVSLESTGPNKTVVKIDNRKHLFGYVLAADWTQPLFEQIEQELKR